MNIVLTGPMGSGKTTVGKQLADALHMSFVDTDELVVKKAGLSIVEIFKASGQEHFRDLEQEIVKNIAEAENTVIATGGGVVLRPINMKRLRKSSLIINLRASARTLASRLKNNQDRPLLLSQDINAALEKHVSERSAFYKNCDFEIETNCLDANEVTQKIIGLARLPVARVCTCISGNEPERQIEKAVQDGASMIELRLDLINNPNIRELISMSGLPVIATDRKNAQNLLKAIEEGCDFVDIDADCAEKQQILKRARQHGCKTILSVHDFEKTPQDLQKLQELISKTKGADISKIVTTAKTKEDCARVLSLLGKEKGLRIALCMSQPGAETRMIQLGTETRIRAPFCGSFLTYSGNVSPGQLGTAETVQKIREIQSGLKMLCVIGDPIAHSLSPVMHNAGLRELGLETEFYYTKIHVKKDQLPAIVEEVRNGTLHGVSVTIPHKEAVMQLADSVTDRAASIGAANTLSKDASGRIVAQNTDCTGFLKALEEAKFDPRGKKIVLLGAGGAAHAVAHSLKNAAELVIVNRESNQAQALAGELANARVGLNEPCDLLVNATPVCPVDKIEAGIAMDLNYSPPKTKLLELAEKSGARTISGLEMLLHQGAEQFEIFTGRKAPVEAMRNALLETTLLETIR